MKTFKRLIPVLLTLVVIALLQTVSFGAIHLHSWHYYWDNGLYAICELCNTRIDVHIKNGETFSYCPGDEINSKEWIENIGWEQDDVSGCYQELKDYVFMYTDINEDSWWFGTPSEPGTYKVAIVLDNDVDIEDISGNYNSFDNYAIVHIGHTISENWIADGTLLCNCCSVCGNHLAEIEIEESFGNACSEKKVVPKFKTRILDESLENQIIDNIPSFIMLFEGIGETEYPLTSAIPNVKGTYGVCFALMEDFENLDTIILRTEPVNYTVQAHVWDYKADEYTIHANCVVCGEHAEVTIDTSTVYEASRTYDGRTLDYEVFYEDNWSCQENIESYTILFSGKETVSETSTTLYDHAFVKPLTTGNYSVRIAILNDPDDPNTAFVSTKEKRYYLADISVSECEILSYGPTQIAQFEEPALIKGYYQVGSLSELLWCLSNKNLTAKINLINDIVVNPITVNEKGEIKSASYQIYKWTGFGNENNPYTGIINGNGYTIYGIYQPDSSVHYNGFINNGKNCNISGLTIENSVLYGIDAAAVIGHYDHAATTDDSITDCHSLNCYLNGNSTCGGIISWYTSTSAGTVTIENCTNDSIICGNSEKGAGGIIGRAAGADALYLKSCYNLGSIESSKGMAGGIIGYLSLDATQGYTAIWDCFNTGSVYCPNYIGGIIGYAVDYKGNKGIHIDNCSTIGYLYASKYLGGIAGYIDTAALTSMRDTENINYYYNAKIGLNTANTNVNLESRAVKLSRTEVNGNFICSKYGHVLSSHRTSVAQANCTKDGEIILKCAVCNSTIESQTIKAYGHRFEYGECVYCGAMEEDEDWLSGSVFGKGPILISLIAAFFLIIIMVIWLIIKRKKQSNT